MDLNISSSAFEPGGMIPDKYTCEGRNVSPPLEWTQVPDEAESLVIIFDDPDASAGPGGPFAHWVVYNIPADTYYFEEDFLSQESQSFEGLVGRNSFGNPYYEGPCPPMGETHRYYLRLYALDVQLELTAGATRAQVIESSQGHILAKAETMGRYSRR